jgi:AcrR family transcriptional regulator
MVAYDAQNWQDFYVMTGGAPAALTGLLFVAMSLRSKAITSNRFFANRAIGSLVSLMLQPPPRCLCHNRLYSEHGFEDTTVAEIAMRAGLTERTFFRHFADKPEVLFAGSDQLQQAIVSALGATPASTRPIDAVAAGLAAAGAYFSAERRDYARRRQAITGSNAKLRERELIKLASLGSAIADTLRRRGVQDPAASLSAEAGMGVFRIAFERWVDKNNEQDWSALVNESLVHLKQLITAQ